MGAEARHIRVRGQVQGVGFRPFVWGLARDLGIVGHVLNDPEGVLILAQADSAETLDLFETRLAEHAPALARVDRVEGERAAPIADTEFTIAASQGVGAETRVTPDAATCLECLDEVTNPDERRHGYAFANCTHCGPRFTILKALPYDRAQTSMADFAMCASCQAEYDDPADRRFHAQPIACADCGPCLWIEPEGDGDPVEDAARRLRGGEILAIKGLGGFHLACDATNGAAVAELRRRKQRPAKPFALMGGIEMARRFGRVTQAEADLLQDPAAPVVLIGKGDEVLPDGPDGIAPGQGHLGWMLPYTPLHHLILAAVERPLVMTSGNLSGEPQVIGNDEARDKLGGFADAFVMHDRDIARRLDDSVERANPPMVLRRARGRVPGTLPLPPGFEAVPQVVGYGGQMKAAICLIKNGQALLGHHLGELDEALTYDAFVQADADYAALFDHKPQVVACDLHPDFRASVYARQRAADQDVPLIEVQHHHAHLASCLAENLWPMDGVPVVGIVLDGTGLGPDGTIWGGEVLLGDYRGYQRLAWLRPAPLIGGDRAGREPWRNALVRLDQVEGEGADWVSQHLSHHPVDLARQAAAKGINAPLASSAGRLFDAVAAILGLCRDAQTYEGEAAMRLEALARGAAMDLGGFAVRTVDACGEGGIPGAEIDPAPVIAAILAAQRQDRDVGHIAAGFHRALARAFADQAARIAKASGARAIALSGGCFQNLRLVQEVELALSDYAPNLTILRHQVTPANDGGLALGQAVIAASRAIGGDPQS